MSTLDPPIPASSILSCWTGRYISSFVAKVASGLHAERRRMQGKSYVVVVSRAWYDYDGLTEFVDLLDAFSTKEMAVAFADRGAQQALAKALAGPTKWMQVDGWSPSFFPRRERPQVSVLRSARFHLKAGSYDSLYVEYLVLHVQAGEALGDELFSYLGAEYEVMRYLSEIR